MPHVSEIRLRVTQPLRQLPENKKADDEAQTNDQEQNSENGRHENPITVLGATRFTQMALEQLVIADIRLKPERKSVADPRNNSDELIDKNVERPGRPRASAPRIEPRKPGSTRRQLPEAVSPRPGISSMSGSSPKRKLVPGNRRIFHRDAQRW
jgi:hypothetical protein